MLSILLVAPLAHRGRVHGFRSLLLNQISLLLAGLGHFAKDGRVEFLLLLLGLLSLPPDQGDLVLGSRVLWVKLQALERIRKCVGINFPFLIKVTLFIT